MTLFDFAVRRALASFAQNSQLFALFDSFGIERFAAIAVIEDHTADAVIVEQGTIGSCFYLISTGKVRILVDVGGGEVKEVAQLGPGNFFGEIAVLTRQPRTATVQCIEDSRLIRFEREQALEILRDYPKVKEIIGGVGLLRSEANLQDALDEGGGLADALEAPDELEGEDNDEDSDVDIVEIDDEALADLLAPPVADSPPSPVEKEAAASDKQSTLDEGDLFGDMESGEGEEGGT